MSRKQRIVILGGGSAGWMTAALLARTLADRFTVELVESSEIGTIGVGEGSVPKIAALFAALGICEGEWMPACDATFKLGIRFRDWAVDPGYETYFHGFYSHFDRDHVKGLKFNAALRRARMDVHAHPDLFIYNAYLADRRLSPRRPESFPFDVQYAYHFDAAKLGQFLKAWSIERGVVWHDCRIASCEKAGDGQISALVTDQGERLPGDFFVDCSGFAALLIEREMGANHVSYRDHLFNDRAVAIATPAQDNPAPMTTATALSAGWAWHIPLQSRTGHGYVYSSRYIDPAAAEAELRDHIGSQAQDAPARHLQMRVGRLDRAWIGNCAAIGLSQGFLEPLEATGLMLSQYTATRLIHHLSTTGNTAEARDGFNREIARSFDGVRDFIVAHYLTASRDDTAYWRDVRTNAKAVSDDLKAVVGTWYGGDDLDRVLRQRRMTDYFSSNSWHYMFSGKGIYPKGERQPPPEDLRAKVPVAEIAGFLDRCALNHRPHFEDLQKMAAEGPPAQPDPDPRDPLSVLHAATPEAA